MRGKIINRLSLKNSNEYIKRKSAEIKELTEKLDEIIIESFYIEVMNIKKEKKQIVERFYNKINFLIS
ncbi:MAG: hypothetical protein PF693_13230, partial [Spirochaetia bacterium]|nr:hypothetical protein [Spirochaetia bacterium]